MLWCDDCWAKYDLARFENLADLFDEGVDVQLMIDDYESVYDKMQRRSWCQKCIDEFQATADGAVETHF